MQSTKNLVTVARARARARRYLPENKSLKSLGLISVAKKLYILYRNIKEDMQLLHRQTVF